MAHKKRSVIEINGHRYDAVSGALLDESFATEAILEVAPQPLLEHHLPVVTRQPAQHAKAHHPDRSHTLMRRSVHQPSKASKLVRSQSHTGYLAATPQVAVAHKLSVQTIHPARAHRAKTVGKSQLIQHYTPASAQTSEKTVPSIKTPVKIAPAPAQHATKPKSASQAVFERALAHANAHEEKPFNPKHHARQQRKHARKLKRAAQPAYRRTSNLAIASFGVLAIAAFATLQYRPSLTMHMANAKAGFSASLPSFRPAGYRYGSFSYKPGYVGIQFKSDDSQRSYSLQQQASNWDDQTLLVKQVASASHSYQALKIAGHIVYIYGQNNASWIDHGVLYQLDSNGSLSTNDVLNIASSL